MACHCEMIDGIIMAQIHGQFSDADLAECAAFAAKYENSPEPAPHRLTNVRGAEEVLFNFDSLEAFAAKRRAVFLRNRVKSAIVANRPALYGLARIFQSLNDHPQIEIRIFSDEKAAIQWLKEPNTE